MDTQNTVWNLFNDLSNKKGISEIVINDPKTVFVERDGRFIQLNVNLSKKDIYDFIGEVAAYNKKSCNRENPMLDGTLPDGSRINAIVEPYAQGCPAISIRKYLKFIKRFDNDHSLFGLSEKWIEFLKAMVHARVNVIVSGGTGVGKTTFMNLLLGELNPAERVVTIEDTLELSFTIPNLVRLESKGQSSVGIKEVSVRDLVKNTLRMRPDRIIIGEVRGEELFDLFQAMNTGHDGSMSSIHANSTSECFSRMETLFLLAGYDVPNQVVKKQISSAVDFVIQLSRDRDGKRIISSISEVTGIESGSILSQVIASYDNGKLSHSGITPKCMQKLNLDGGLPIDFFNTKGL